MIPLRTYIGDWIVDNRRFLQFALAGAIVMLLLGTILPGPAYFWMAIWFLVLGALAAEMLAMRFFEWIGDLAHR